MVASMYDSITDALNSAWNVLLSITPIDIVDMVLLTYLVYLFIKLMRETRAGQLIKGIILFIIAYLISKNIGLKAITYIIDRMLDIGLVALIVMFQPELRRGAELLVAHVTCGFHRGAGGSQFFRSPRLTHAFLLLRPCASSPARW